HAFPVEDGTGTNHIAYRITNTSSTAVPPGPSIRTTTAGGTGTASAAGFTSVTGSPAASSAGRTTNPATSGHTNSVHAAGPPNPSRGDCRRHSHRRPWTVTTSYRTTAGSSAGAIVPRSRLAWPDRTTAPPSLRMVSAPARS